MAGALLHLRPTAVATGLCLYFPAVTVGTNVDVATPTCGPITVPPVALDSHLFNVWGSSPLGNTAARACHGRPAASRDTGRGR